MENNKRLMITMMVACALGVNVNYAANIDAVTVTAQRIEKKAIDTPVTTITLTQEDIKNTGEKNLFDAISFATGVTNSAFGGAGLDYGAMTSRVNLRGFDRGTAILVNGSPISVNGKSTLDTFMLDNIDRVEISKGANSVLYGPEAIGGVINIITKVGDKPTTKVDFALGNLGQKRYKVAYSDANIFVGYSEEKHGKISHTTPVRKAYSRVGHKRTPKKDYYMNIGYGEKKNIAVSIQANDRLRVNLMRNERETNFEKILFNAGTPKEVDKNSKKQRYFDDKNNVDLVYQDINNKIKGVVYYHNRLLNGEETKGLSGAFNPKINTSYRAYNYGSDLQKTWDFTKQNAKKDTLVSGLMVEKEGHTAVKNGEKTHRENMAVYAQYTHQHTDRLFTTVGVREEFISDPVENRNVFLPQFQSLYKVNNENSYYVNIGKAFQMPTLKDMQKTADNIVIREISGKNLQPEEGWNYEIGYKHITPKEQLKAAIFYMDIDNMFDWYNQKGEYKNTSDAIRINNGEFKNVGFELDYARNISSNLTATAGFTLANPQNKVNANDSWKQIFPKLQCNLGVQYQAGKLTTAVAANYIGKRNRNIDGEITKPLININTRFSYKASENDEITLTLNNILDRDNVVSQGEYEYYGLPYNWMIGYTRHF